MLIGLILATSLAADPQDGVKQAWMECGRGARTATQVQECQLAFMGRLAASVEPRTEHGRRVAAIVEAQRAAREARDAEHRAQAERAQAAAAAADEARSARVAEEERTKREQEETEHLLTALQQDPGAMRLVWSSVICRWTAIRADAKREIELEKKYADEGGGVVNKANLYSEQQRMRRADERIDRARHELREFDAKPPLPCKDKSVFAPVACLTAEWQGVDLDDDGRRICHSRDMVLLNEVVYRSDSYLRR